MYQILVNGEVVKTVATLNSVKVQIVGSNYRLSTDKMRKAVTFVEAWMPNIKFTGDINSFKDVHAFLNEYLDEAKVICEDATESYYSYMADKDY